MRSLFILTLSLLAMTASAQKTTLLIPKKGTEAPIPAAAPAPVTYSTPTPTYPAAQANSRRASAVAKVMKMSSTTTAKSVGPENGDLTPVTYSTISQSAPAPSPATTVTVNGEEKLRDVRAGKGQVHFGVFTPVNELYFIQFGVFCKDTPVTHAPAVDGVYLVWHAESTCPGGSQGAAYIVKGLPTAEEAIAESKALKAKGIDCWYNPALTGAKVEIIGVR